MGGDIVHRWHWWKLDINQGRIGQPHPGVSTKGMHININCDLDTWYLLQHVFNSSMRVLKTKYIISLRKAYGTNHLRSLYAMDDLVATINKASSAMEKN